MKIGILTGGGDVAPLNAIIASVIDSCRSHSVELFGFIKGWNGILLNELIQLDNKTINANIGGTILKSSRVNLKSIANGSEKILQQLKKNKIDGLIVIGGEDTLSNALYLKDFPMVLISKTIDNDVGKYQNGIFLNYFTMGYPTAAAKIASFVSLAEGLRTTAYSHERIIVVESMGMHAGWLAAASSLGYPDFIIIPEFPLDFNKFVLKVIERYNKEKNVIVVISEGARWASGEYISADENQKDSFGHPRFRGTADALTQKLKVHLKNHFDTRNINSVNPSYLYRSGQSSFLDQKIANKIGAEAVRVLFQGINNTVFLGTAFIKNRFEIELTDFSLIKNIEEFHRFIDDTIYNPSDYNITTVGMKYFSQIMQPIANYTYGI